MKSKDRVRKSLAVPQLAVQPHASSLRHITTCPYCHFWDRKIRLDTAAVVAACERHGGPLHVFLREHPNKRLIVFGETAKSQPCEHIALMWGSSDWEADDQIMGFEFDLDHPILAKFDRELEIFLDEQVVTRTCGRRFMPATPVLRRTIRKQFPAPLGPDRIGSMQLRAWITFALDVPALFRELAAKYEQFDRAMAVGDRPV